MHVVGGGVRFLADCDRQFRHVPWVFTAHNVPPAERIFGKFHRNGRLHYAIRNAIAMPSVWSWSRYVKTAGFRVAICHSQTVARRLQAVGCPADKIQQIPFGSELPASALEPDPATESPFPKDAFPKLLTIAGLRITRANLTPSAWRPDCSPIFQSSATA